jgi:hypothetical protein
MAMILKAVSPGHGARWVRDGLRLYMRRPMAFTSLFVLFLFAALFSALIPVIGGVLQVAILPLLSLGFMVASQSVLLEGPAHPRQFIEPLRTDASRRRSLLLLCALYGLAVMLSLWLCDLVSGGAFSRAMDLMRQTTPPPAEMQALLADRGLLSGTLLGTLLLSLLSVPFWHAPALVHWGSQGVGQALFSSTLAVWRSRGAFFVYMLLWCALVMAVGVVSALLFGLLGMREVGSFVALPVGLFFSTLFYVSLIFTFNDSFGSA